MHYFYPAKSVYCMGVNFVIQSLDFVLLLYFSEVRFTLSERWFEP